MNGATGRLASIENLFLQLLKSNFSGSTLLSSLKFIVDFNSGWFTGGSIFLATSDNSYTKSDFLFLIQSKLGSKVDFDS